MVFSVTGCGNNGTEELISNDTQSESAAGDTADSAASDGQVKLTFLRAGTDAEKKRSGTKSLRILKKQTQT